MILSATVKQTTYRNVIMEMVEKAEETLLENTDYTPYIFYS